MNKALVKVDNLVYNSGDTQARSMDDEDISYHINFIEYFIIKKEIDVEEMLSDVKNFLKSTYKRLRKGLGYVVMSVKNSMSWTLDKITEHLWRNKNVEVVETELLVVKESDNRNKLDPSRAEDGSSKVGNHPSEVSSSYDIIGKIRCLITNLNESIKNRMIELFSKVESWWNDDN